jgi:hypothetical protein
MSMTAVMTSTPTTRIFAAAPLRIMLSATLAA